MRLALAAAGPQRSRRLRLGLLYLTSVLFGFTAIAHQNNLGATASVLAGDAFTQYGFAIGLTLGGMFVGFLLSSGVRGRLIDRFLSVEIALTVVSGFSVLAGFAAYAALPDGYVWVVRAFIAAIAVLVGLEDALLVRIVEEIEGDLPRSLGWTFASSNIGGMFAGVLFGLWIFPTFGIFATAAGLGLLDGVVVAVNLWVFRAQVGRLLPKAALLGVAVAALAAALNANQQVGRALTQALYSDPVQREWREESGTSMVLTCSRHQDCRLFINGQLQFSSRDEALYHERLVHPALAVAGARVKGRPLNVLIAGGGDGLAARELLRYRPEGCAAGQPCTGVGAITVVDLSRLMTDEVAVSEPVVSYNQGALRDPRVRVVNADAFVYLRDSAELYDLVIVDLVDPDSPGAAKLYSQEFYAIVASRLAHGGVLVSQSTSPWYAPQAFWAINVTMESVFPSVVPMRWNIPSFGDWGWNMASAVPIRPEEVRIDESKTRGLTSEGFRATLFFEREELAIRDTLRARGVVSTIAGPVVMQYYLDPAAWAGWGSPDINAR